MTSWLLWVTSTVVGDISKSKSCGGVRSSAKIGLEKIPIQITINNKASAFIITIPCE
jgi:hypothetical protein